jgi:hypothetical protein
MRARARLHRLEQQRRGARTGIRRIFISGPRFASDAGVPCPEHDACWVTTYGVIETHSFLAQSPGVVAAVTRTVDDTRHKDVAGPS